MWSSKQPENTTNFANLTEKMTPAVVTINGKDCHVAAGEALNKTFFRDQIDANHSITDLHLVCHDGHIPVHRYILMASSPFLLDLLINEDPSELVVIHLFDTKIVHLVQVMSLVYTGKTVISPIDQDPIFSTMKSLGISTKNFEFRLSKDANTMTANLRCYTKEESDIQEETFINASLVNEVCKSKMKEKNLPKQPINNRTASKRKTGNCEPLTLSKDTNIVTAPRPRMLSKRNIDKADNQKPLTVKVELPSPAEVETTNFQCQMCQLKFKEEQSLVDHLTTACGSHLKSNFEYWDRQCLVCKNNFESFDIWKLLGHVGSCTGRKRLKTPSFLDMESQNDGSKKDDPKGSPQSLTQPLAPKMQETVAEVSQEIQGTEKMKRQFLRFEISEGAIKAVQSKILTENMEVQDFEMEVDKESPAPPLKMKKRRRRRVAQYTSKRRRPKKKVDSPSDSQSCQSPILLDSFSKVDDGENGCDMSGDESENITDDKISKTFSEPLVVVDNPIKKENEFNPDLIRLKLGINSLADIENLSDEKLKLVFRTCPFCEKEYVKIKDVSKCLRYHGYRYCWVCLKILPYKGPAFDTHSVSEHCIRNEKGEVNDKDKVLCPLCSKEFEYKLGLPTHLGNFHFPRIVDTNDDYLEISTEVEAYYSNNNLLDEDPPSPPTDMGLLVMINEDDSGFNVDANRNCDPSKLRDILSGPSTSNLSGSHSEEVEDLRTPTTTTFLERNVRKPKKSKNNSKSVASSESSSQSNDSQGIIIKEEAPESNENSQVFTAPGRRFLRQTVIDGVTYNIFCSIGDLDEKRVIAIPANKLG